VRESASEHDVQRTGDIRNSTNSVAYNAIHEFVLRVSDALPLLASVLPAVARRDPLDHVVRTDIDDG
jgi:hypothetical protein